MIISVIGGVILLSFGDPSDRHPRPLAFRFESAGRAAGLRDCREPATAGAAGAQRVRAVERDRAVLMILAYGYPIGQFFFLKQHSVPAVAVTSQSDSSGTTVMVREQGPLKLDNPWPRIAWGSMAVVFVVSFLIGFFVLGRFQQNGPTLGSWAAFCRAIGLSCRQRAGKRSHNRHNERRRELPGPETRWRESSPATNSTAPSSRSIAAPAMASVA